MKRREKDPDQQAAYHAEMVAFEGTLFDEPLASDDFMRLADSLFSHDWWQRNRLTTPIIEPTRWVDRSSHAMVYYEKTSKDPIIRIAPQQINAWTLAHEAAHVAQYQLFLPTTHGEIASHGWEFRSVYLAVAKILLGQDAALSLSRNFAQFVRDGGSLPFIVPADSASDMGIFPAWRLAQRRAELDRLQQRMPAPSVPRIKGAIAL